MQHRKNGSMLHKLLVGARLRCPNCETGDILQQGATLKMHCPVCQVRFERAPGEGTGAMMIALSLVPLPLILLFFVLTGIFQVPWLPLVIALPIVLVIAIVLSYRHARGIWLSVIFLTEGLFTDAEKPYTPLR
jgi:uncharacterized protein (DUF983 family)